MRLNDEDIRINGRSPAVASPTIRRADLLACLRSLFKERCGCRESATQYDPQHTTACALRAEADGIDYCLHELSARFSIPWEEIEGEER